VVNIPGGNDLSAIDKKIVAVADALGKQTEGDALRHAVAAQIAQIPTQPLGKRVLFILSHGGMNTMVAGQKTAADGAIQAAGLQNAMQGFDHYRSMSQEGVIASLPDLVVISADGLKGMGGEAGLWKLPGLAQTPAGRHKQLLVIDDMALLGFGPRTPQAISALRKSGAAPLMRPTLSPSVVNDAAAGEPDAVRDDPRRDASAARQSVAAGDEVLRHIWLTIRLPRVLLALLVGAALALSGCVMQGLFRNPLADPGLLGVSSGAALAVACWLVLPLSVPALVALYAPMLAAFIGSIAVMVVIFILSQASEGSLSRLLLVGIAINALCGALVGVLAWISNDTQLRQLSLWGMGSLGQAEWSTLLVAATLIFPASLVIWLMASRLNLLQLGDEEAHYLGINVRAVQRLLLLCSALLVASSVAISGVIGFIGLVVPHLIRMWLGPDHRALVPGSLLAGAILLLLADTLARTVAAPAEMPVGLLTSMLGAPWFLWLIFRQQRTTYG
jgi:iron complex transport system permease protein